MKKAIIGTVAAAAGIVTVAGNVLYRQALKAHINRDKVFQNNANQTSFDPAKLTLDDISAIDFSEAWISSKYDGLTLHGSIVDRNSDTWVITAHGYSMPSGKLMVNMTSGFENKGYSILYPDMRGHGDSEGSYIGMGWHDRFDIISWAEFINEKYAPKNIIFYGISMGGASVMMAAGEELPSNVRCIIEDCGYVSVKEEMRHEAKLMYKLPYYPFVWAGSIVSKIRANWSFKEADAVAGLMKAEVPILFIHGESDTFVPLWNAEIAYEVCASEKEKLIVPGAGHAESQHVDSELYWNTISAFTDKYLV